MPLWSLKCPVFPAGKVEENRDKKERTASETMPFSLFCVGLCRVGLCLSRSLSRRENERRKQVNAHGQHMLHAVRSLQTPLWSQFRGCGTLAVSHVHTCKKRCAFVKGMWEKLEGTGRYRPVPSVFSPVRKNRVPSTGPYEGLQDSPVLDILDVRFGKVSSMFIRADHFTMPATSLAKSSTRFSRPSPFS